MKKPISLLLLIFLLLLGCKAKKAAVVSVQNEKEIELIPSSFKAQDFKIVNAAVIDKADLMFSMKGITLMEKMVEVKVQYGGGCVKPHIFELVTDGVIDDQGNMKFHLLHKTHHDKCKALLMESLVFNLEPLYNLESEKLKSFQVNNMRKIELD